MNRSSVATPDPVDRLSTGESPGLLEYAGAFGISWAASAVILGVLLVVVGLFQPMIVLVVAGLTAAVAVRPVWRRSDRRLRPPDAAVIGLIVVWAVVGMQHVGQHVFPGSDPGVYLGSGWWLAENPSAEIELAPGLLDDSDGSYRMSGFYDTGDGSLAPQFPRGLPVLIAIGRSLAGPAGAFATPLAIGAASLLVLYLLASRFVNRWWAVLAVAALAVSFPLAHFTRDAYSETLAMLLLLGGAWLLVDAIRSGDRAWALLSGLALGAALCVRIDALIAMSALPLVVIHGAAFTAPGKRRPAGPVAMAGAVAAGAGLVALADLTVLDASYLEAQGGRLAQVAVVVAVACIVAVLAERRAERLADLLRPRRETVATVAAVVLGLAFAYLFVVRPLGPVATGATHDFLDEVLRREGAADPPGRTLEEISGVWLWWYLGPLLVAGLLGLVEMTRRMIRRPDPAQALLVSLFLGTGLVYLWRPSIVPLQPWAMRRYLPVVIPTLVVAGVWAMSLVAARLRSRPRLRAGLVVVLVLIALSPIVALASVWDTTEQKGAYTFVDDVCADLPDDAVLFSDSSIASRQWGPVLRIYCDVPVLVTSSAALPELMSAASTEGDVLWFGGCELPGAYVSEAAAGFPITEFTATGPPDELTADFFSIRIVRPTSFECPQQG